MAGFVILQIYQLARWAETQADVTWWGPSVEEAAAVYGGIRPAHVTMLAMTISGALAGLLVWLLPTYDVMGRMRAEERKKEQAAKAQQVIAQEVKKAQEVRERMKQKGLLTEDLKNKLDEMEAKMAELARNPEKMSVEPIKPMTSLKEQIKQDQGNLQQQLEGMQSALAKLSLSQMNKEGLVSKLSKELATGNFKDAKESMKELQAKIQEAAKDPAKAAELASDLAKLAAALQDQSLDNKLSNELKAAGLSDDQLNKLDQAMKQGKQLSEADMKDLKDAMKQQGLSESQATEMMQKLASAMKGAQMACQMGQALSDAAQCMKQGQGQQGSQGQQGQQGQGRQGSQGQGQQMAGGQGQSGGMGSAQQALSEMEALQAQALEMQALLADIQGTQGSMSSAEGQGQFGQGGNLNSSGAGMGRLGRGRGGVAPVQPGPTAMTPSKVKGTWQKGRMIGEYFDDSQQVKGESRSQLVEIVNAAQQEATKTIDEHKLPPQYDSTVERYFSELRQLDQQKKNPQPAQ